MVSQPGFWDFARNLDALSANADPLERVATSRPRPQAPTEPNQVWSYDFVFDRCANGQQLKCLTVTDESTRGW